MPTRKRRGRSGAVNGLSEAAKKVVHVGALVCSCGEEKSRYSATCHDCASERKRVGA